VRGIGPENLFIEPDRSLLLVYGQVRLGSGEKMPYCPVIVLFMDEKASKRLMGGAVPGVKSQYLLVNSHHVIVFSSLFQPGRSIREEANLIEVNFEAPGERCGSIIRCRQEITGVQHIREESLFESLGCLERAQCFPGLICFHAFLCQEAVMPGSLSRPVELCQECCHLFRDRPVRRFELQCILQKEEGFFRHFVFIEDSSPLYKELE